MVFDLGSIDVVLGFSWLATLGETRTNWRLLRLSWKIGSYWVTIVGDLALSREQVYLNSLERVVQQTRLVYCVELTALFENNDQPRQSPDSPTSREILGVIEQFKDVFDMPKGLPPIRNSAHAITLQEGSGPVNLRPYLYSFTQKMRLKNLCRKCSRRRSFALVSAHTLVQSYWSKRRMGVGVFVLITELSTRPPFRIDIQSQ